MRLTWLSSLVVLPIALSMCGPDSATSENDDSDDDSAAGNGSSGTNAGGSAGSGRGGSSSGSTGEAGAAGDGSSSGGASGASGTGGATGGSSGTGGDAGCADTPVDVLVLLDRSASMQDPPTLSGGTISKWELTIPPLLDALSTTLPIRWGLKTFPDGAADAPACGAGIVSVGLDVPVADDNVEAVRQAILATTPEGPGTPTGDSVRLAAADFLASGSENQKFILLVTDGAPSCINVTPTSNGTEGQEAARPYAVQAISDARTAGLETFLLGIGADTELAQNTLSQMALAGGRPMPEVNPLEFSFYSANDAAGVTSAMEAILRSASLCEAPPPPSLPLPYRDDFDSRGAADWRFTLIPWAVTDDGGNDVLQLTSTSASSEETWAVGGDRNWTNVRVEMRVKFVSGDGVIRLSPRWKDLDNYMFVEYEATDAPKLRRRLAGSTVNIITSDRMLTFAPGQWHTVAVTLNGTAATLEFDGTVVGTGTDATPVPSGGVAIAVDDAIIAIDDVEVTAP